MITLLIIHMFNKLALFMMLIYLLSTSTFFSKIMTKKQVSIRESLVLIGIFGSIGALGNWLALVYNGALVNTRIIGVAAGGIYGGPIVGFGAAVIAVIHRILIGKGDFTVLACCLSTPLEGLVAGYIGKLLVGKKNRWVGGMLIGGFCELLRKAMVLLISRPFHMALDLVKVIIFPMTLVNSLGLGIFIVMVDKIFEEQEKLKSHQARLCLNIANRTLPILRRGLNTETALQAADIIYLMSDFDAVSITNTKEILSHVGTGSDHHKNGSKPLTNITNMALQGNSLIIAQDKKHIGCKVKTCMLMSSIVIPLKNNEEVIGALKLYRCRENSISDADIEIGLGLAHLFSTQLELSILDEQAKIITKARIKMLQSQMNPHFLFNSLNAISILCRVDPLKARDTINHLANYYRKNLKNTEDSISIKDEVDHIKSYLAIEKARFNDKLKVFYDIDEDVDIKIPPLTIQPLVENAINHGILPRVNGGRVWIEVKDFGDMVKLCVRDDGVGIDEKMLSDIQLSNFPKGSLGLELIAKRLHFIFGEKVYFSIESVVGKGTIVSIIILKDEGCISSESIVS